jgi:hypothetical protein
MAEKPIDGDGAAVPAAHGAQGEERPGDHKCPLCGGVVPADRDHCAAGCPLAKGCRVLCCPSCGYEFVEDSAIASGVSRLVGWIRRRNERPSADR